MKLHPAEQEQIVALLTRIYTDIHDIEEEFQLLAGGGDFRPRIEHFHDAVRAFTTQEPQGIKDARLSIENLSYDLQCLRFITESPLSPFKAETGSPGTQVVKVDNGLTVKSKRPDRALRERISELYRHYAVLFAALLKPMADRDYHERTDNLNQDVQDLKSLIQQLGAMEQGKGSLEKVVAAVSHLEDEDLRQQLNNFIQQQQHKKKDALAKLMQFLKLHSNQIDKDIKKIDGAHMQYALSQLGIYEGSKDMIKKMANQGMNIVGKFVEASVAQTKREMGR